MHFDRLKSFYVLTDAKVCVGGGGGGGGGERERERPNDFKFGTVISRFPSDGAASIAVKGLNKRSKQFYFTCVPALVSNRTDTRRLITVCRQRRRVFSLHFNGT